MKEKAQVIVDAILADHNGRKGLRHEWDNIDEEIQEEIRQEWIDITENLLSSPWLPIADAPKDGTMILGCALGPWESKLDQFKAPKAIRWGSFHPNSPGKTCWRDADGKPMNHFTHFQHLPEPPKVSMLHDFKKELGL